MNLKIVADENIPFVEDAFGTIGSVSCFPGRELSPEQIKQADILLVRSVTKITEQLLADSAVKIVCSATIGTDHVDLAYLQRKGIAFFNAAGSNANSVAEYVITAVLELAIKYNLKIADITLAVVGVGNIGRMVKTYAETLGATVLLNDPPLARQTGDRHFKTLDELMDADILTIHVPLNRTGIDKTVHLFDFNRLKMMKKNAVLINTSRGPVVDSQALKRVLEEHHLQAAVLDVWENEPTIDFELLKLVEIGTPHIAGYSLDGKVNGTYQIYQAVCNHLNRRPEWHPEKSLPRINDNSLQFDRPSSNEESNLINLIRQIYDIRADDSRLREILRQAQNKHGKYFDQLRKNYPVRREFHNYRIKSDKPSAPGLKKLKSLGFRFD